jgi:hypothetical protein
MALQSFYAQLFTGLQARIKAAVPEIRWIDQDIGQLEAYDIRPTVSFPCVLIDFPATNFQDESKQVQWGDVTIELRLAFAPFSQSSNTAPALVQEKALQFWELEMKLYQALQAWYAMDAAAAPICQPLTRVSSATEKREDNIRVRSMRFTTAFQDETATPAFVKKPRPTLTIE